MPHNPELTAPDLNPGKTGLTLSSEISPEVTATLTEIAAAELSGTLDAPWLLNLMTAGSGALLRGLLDHLPPATLALAGSGRLASPLLDRATPMILQVMKTEPGGTWEDAQNSPSLWQLTALSAGDSSPAESWTGTLTRASKGARLPEPWRRLLLLSYASLTGTFPEEAARLLNIDDLPTLAIAAAEHHSQAVHLKLRSPHVPFSVSSLQRAVATGLLETLARKPALSSRNQEVWDRALQAMPIEKNMNVQRLDALLARTMFDPGKMTPLKALGSAEYQALLAGCPGVPAGRLRITSVRAAGVAQKRGTPSWETARSNPAFARLLGDDQLPQQPSVQQPSAQQPSAQQPSAQQLPRSTPDADRR